MQTLISFLRGVNITGHNSIKMRDLSALYNDLGYNGAETYIQSGNVIFTENDVEPVSDISLKIEKAIFQRFGFVVPVMIRTLQDMQKLVSVNPFLNENNFDPAKMAVLFLHEECKISQIEKVADISYPPDKFVIKEREIFIYCPNGFGRTKLYTTFFEQKMGVTGTARNWKTISTIIENALNK